MNTCTYADHPLITTHHILGLIVSLQVTLHKQMSVIYVHPKEGGSRHVADDLVLDGASQVLVDGLDLGVELTSDRCVLRDARVLVGCVDEGRARLVPGDGHYHSGVGCALRVPTVRGSDTELFREGHIFFYMGK